MEEETVARNISIVMLPMITVMTIFSTADRNLRTTSVLRARFVCSRVALPHVRRRREEAEDAARHRDLPRVGPHRVNARLERARRAAETLLSRHSKTPGRK